MCGRYASSRRDAELASELDLSTVVGEELPPSWNVAPTQDGRVVLERRRRDDPNAEPVREIRTMRWGLVPSWAKDPHVGSKMINARIETVTDRPAYQAAASRRRCLVPADGYFEWERRPGREGTVPHFLHGNGEPLMFAGLYELWRNPDVPEADSARWLATFTILTTTAPDALGHIHERSPVVIPPELRGDWLDPDLTEVGKVRGLLAQVPEPGFAAYEVSARVNDHRNNGPDLVEPVILEG